MRSTWEKKKSVLDFSMNSGQRNSENEVRTFDRHGACVTLVLHGFKGQANNDPSEFYLLLVLTPTETSLFGKNQRLIFFPALPCDQGTRTGGVWKEAKAPYSHFYRRSGFFPFE